jgi:hypothetical protein
MPRALLQEGNIEIWDIDKKVKLEVAANAINQPISWFPDGRHLAYVKLVPRDELPKDAPGLSVFGEYFGETWDELPAICVLDIETSKSRFLHVGWTPVVAFDGKSILVGGWDRQSKFSWYSFDNERRQSSPARWPGDAGGAIAKPAHNIVLYKGLPTAGEPIEYTKGNSLVGGARPMVTLKLAFIDSNRFQTVVPAIDYRDPVSFGQVIDHK